MFFFPNKSQSTHFFFVNLQRVLFFFVCRHLYFIYCAFAHDSFEYSQKKKNILKKKKKFLKTFWLITHTYTQTKRKKLRVQKKKHTQKKCKKKIIVCVCVCEKLEKKMTHKNKQRNNANQQQSYYYYPTRTNLTFLNNFFQI